MALNFVNMIKLNIIVKNVHCEHNIQKTRCKECDGKSLCIHNKRKDYCKDCNGVAFCEHNIQKHRCKKCGGKGICEHDKRKERCRICSPNSNSFCKECKIFIVYKKNNYLCSYCNPDKPTRQKIKELKVKTFLEENQYKFEYNKFCTYQDKRFFPDFKIDCNTFYLIIECDEYAHRTYDKNDEKTREDNIRLALNKKCIFIRYNPDNKVSKKTTINIKQNILKSYIDYYINKELSDNEVCYLFY